MKKNTYADGYADGWIHVLERMANLSGLSEQAAEVYRALWAHWEHELLPWAQNGFDGSVPSFRSGEPIGFCVEQGVDS